jgi:DNA adenine methylase
VEPFAGSAAVSLAAAHHGKAQRFVLNDINAPLMHLWESVINSPHTIASQYKVLWDTQRGREREYYDTVRDEFNRTHRADCFLYLLARCVKASVRYNPRGEFNQSPDNRRRGAHPKTMTQRIVGASRLLRGKTLLLYADYRDVLASVIPDDVVYMDPPYQGVCGGRDARYVGQFSHDSFTEALSDLNARGVYYLVSYDGRHGLKTYGEPLPSSLDLTRIEIEAGRSSQATLLGRDAKTFESLYLSPALSRRLQERPEALPITRAKQGSFWS